MLRQQQCDRSLTTRFLVDQLNDSEQLAFEQHLESCPQCREELAAVAAEGELWDEVRETLGSHRPMISSSGSSPSSEGDDDIKSSCDAVLAMLHPTDDPHMLGRFGGYEIAGIVGRGGMGVVLKGFDTALNRFVAIKVLAPHLATSGAARKRFSREAQAAAAVVHDNVIAIHSVAEEHGHPYVVMPYERGPSLQKRVDDCGPLAVVEVLRIGMQAARGLAAAHAQGIVHRDVKPANILLSNGTERVKLTDFGLARAADDASLTRTGVIAGTPQYMSPEQARGESVDQRSDLFSLGSVLYTMCTGRAPFRAETSYGILRRITDTEPRPIREVNPEIPEWLCAIIGKLMAKQPDDRFTSAAEVAELLEECLAHVQQPTTVTLPWRKLPACKPTRQAGSLPHGAPRTPWTGTPRLIGLAAFAFVLILSGVVIVLESNKGTLMIESEADNVPIRIVQGDDTVKRLTVSREGTTTRLHVGQYTLEIDGADTTYEFTNGNVVVHRGETRLAKVTYAVREDDAASSLTPERPLAAAVREFNHLHSKDAQGQTQQPLTQSEVIACLLWKMGNDELSDDIVAAIQPILYNEDRLVPAGWELTGGLVRRRCEQGIVQTWEVKLETNGVSLPISIRQTPIAAPASLRKAGQQVDGDVASIPLAEAIDEFNASIKEREDFQRLDIRAFSYGHELTFLNVDEVLAAIALWQTRHDETDVDDATFKQLQQIAATHRLPAGTRFEFIPVVKNAIDQWFSVSSFRMLVPRVDQPDSPFSLTIRHRFMELDSSHPGATNWSGPGSNGIQAGVRLVPAQRTFQHDQVVDIEFLYRSVTDEEVAANLAGDFRYEEVTGIRLIEVRDAKQSGSGGSISTTIGAKPTVVRGHRMQICIDPESELKDGVTLRAITKPGASHFVRFVVPNPGVDAVGEQLEIRDRLFFNTPRLTPPKVLPVYVGHYYRHWGTTVPGHRWPAKSTPDPAYADPFQIGVSLGCVAEKSRIPNYYAGGFKVTKVAPHSPAEIAGIEVGDILLAWEGHQFHGDEPQKPFRNYNRPNNHWRERLQAFERFGRLLALGSSSTTITLLDHRTGEVVDVESVFGGTGDRSSNKSRSVRHALDRKLNRDASALKSDLEDKVAGRLSEQPADEDEARAGIVDWSRLSGHWMPAPESKPLLDLHYATHSDESEMIFHVDEKLGSSLPGEPANFLRDYLKGWQTDDADVVVATGTFKPASLAEQAGDLFVLTRRKTDGRTRMLYGVVGGGHPFVEWKPSTDRSADQLVIHWTRDDAYSPLDVNLDVESRAITYVRQPKAKVPETVTGRSHAGMLSVRIVENAVKPKVLVDSTIEVSPDGKFNFTSGGEITGKDPIRVLLFDTRLTGWLADLPNGSTQLDLKVELVNRVDRENGDGQRLHTESRHIRTLIVPGKTQTLKFDNKRCEVRFEVKHEHAEDVPRGVDALEFERIRKDPPDAQRLSPDPVGDPKTPKDRTIE